MSRQSVYEALKSAIQYRGFPYHHFEDEYCTIAFASWEQFRPFDHALSAIPTPNNIKLNIYAERVGGRSDGVAVTVSDEVQLLGYWDTYFNMEEKVSAFEEVISSLLRSGVSVIDYDYRVFVVDIDADEHRRVQQIENPHYISNWQDSFGRDIKRIHLEFRN